MTSTIQLGQARPGSDPISSWEEHPLFHATRLCLAFLQGLFSQSIKGKFKWDEDPEETELIITSEQPISADVINKRPAIVTVRSPVAWAGIALDQLQSYSIKTGSRIHTDLISGNMSFNCIAKKIVEAEYLAWVTARHLWILRRMFLKSGFHDFGRNIQILSASPPGSIVAGAMEPESVNVPVIVPFYFQWMDTISETDLQTLQHIEARITVLPPEPPHQLTTMAVGGSPGPGLSGTATGARTQNVVKGKLRPPWMPGVYTPLPNDRLPSSQQPGATPLTITVKVDE